MAGGSTATVSSRHPAGRTGRRNVRPGAAAAAPVSSHTVAAAGSSPYPSNRHRRRRRRDGAPTRSRHHRRRLSRARNGAAPAGAGPNVVSRVASSSVRAGVSRHRTPHRRRGGPVRSSSRASGAHRVGRKLPSPVSRPGRLPVRKLGPSPVHRRARRRYQVRPGRAPVSCASRTTDAGVESSRPILRRTGLRRRRSLRPSLHIRAVPVPPSRPRSTRTRRRPPRRPGAGVVRWARMSPSRSRAESWAC
jgi:hypothetical protein